MATWVIHELHCCDLWANYSTHRIFLRGQKFTLFVIVKNLCQKSKLSWGLQVALICFTMLFIFKDKFYEIQQFFYNKWYYYVKLGTVQRGSFTFELFILRQNPWSPLRISFIRTMFYSIGQININYTHILMYSTASKETLVNGLF